VRPGTTQTKFIECRGLTANGRSRADGAIARPAGWPDTRSVIRVTVAGIVGIVRLVHIGRLTQCFLSTFLLAFVTLFLQALPESGAFV
jgi:hypothetical protein